MNDPFLFDDLADDLSTDPALAPPTVQVYTSPIEQATFDIMELVDGYFCSSVTVEEYDAAQKKVKGILTEAFGEKGKETPRRALISRPD
jgi:hypothetical protein